MLLQPWIARDINFRAFNIHNNIILSRPQRSHKALLSSHQLYIYSDKANLQEQIRHDAEREFYPEQPWFTRFCSSPASVSLHPPTGGLPPLETNLSHSRHRHTLCSTRHRNASLFPARHVMGISIVREHWRLFWILAEWGRRETSEAVTAEKRDHC